MLSHCHEHTAVFFFNALHLNTTQQLLHTMKAINKDPAHVITNVTSVGFKLQSSAKSG